MEQKNNNNETFTQKYAFSNRTNNNIEIKQLDIDIKDLYKNYMLNQNKNINFFFNHYYEFLYKKSPCENKKYQYFLNVIHKTNSIKYMFEKMHNKYYFSITDDKGMSYIGISGIDENGNNGTFGIKLKIYKTTSYINDIIENFLLSLELQYDINDMNDLQELILIAIRNNSNNFSSIEDKIISLYKRKYSSHNLKVIIYGNNSNGDNLNENTYHEYLYLLIKDKYNIQSLIDKIKHINQEINNFEKDKKKLIRLERNNFTNIYLLNIFLFGCIGGISFVIGDASFGKTIFYDKTLNQNLKNNLKNNNVFLYPLRLLSNKRSIYFPDNLVGIIEQSGNIPKVKSKINTIKKIRLIDYIREETNNKNLLNRKNKLLSSLNSINDPFYHTLLNYTIEEFINWYNNYDLNNPIYQNKNLIKFASKIIYFITLKIKMNSNVLDTTHYTIILNPERIKYLKKIMEKLDLSNVE